MFKITKEWIDKYKTTNGAYTFKQLQLLGFDTWPPLKGWKKSVIGLHISEEARLKFEKASKDESEKPFIRSTVKDVCSKIRKGFLNSDELSKILNVLRRMGHI